MISGNKLFVVRPDKIDFFRSYPMRDALKINENNSINNVAPFYFFVMNTFSYHHMNGLKLVYSLLNFRV